jgi:hypothetical protein
MLGRRWLCGACAMLAGCNLLSGAADLVAGADPGTSGDVDAGFDGSLAAAGDSSGGGPDGSRDATTTSDGGTLPIPDAAIDALDASPPRPDGGRFVFVSSTQTTGDLGGVAGADMSCTTFAVNAGLGGVWMAWVSTGASAASSRLTSAGPWYLVTGARVAASKAALAGNAALEHPIDRDEQGVQRISSPVWTGTGLGNFGDCSSWTSPLASIMAETGSTQYASLQWQQLGSAACSTTHRLYCFEN